MRYRLLACDYDGTLARHGAVDPDTLEALRKVVESGRKLALVTGRELHELFNAFPEATTLFEWIVAENGGLLYQPTTREETPLAPEPSGGLVSLLQARGVSPLSIGKVIVATWEPHETVVLSSIRELGLELQVIFNKGAVMILPAGINKRSGLEAVIDKLGLSAHEVVGIGDAENDHAFLSFCECSVAVENALPSLKESADWVTKSPQGEGARELIERLLEDDLHSLDTRLSRHHILVGAADDGVDVTIPPYGPAVLVAGRSGSGKSTATLGLLERLATKGYQICIIDPEGDHEAFEGAVVAGTQEQPPEVEQVLKILARPQNHAVVNLLGVPIVDRPKFFLGLLARLHELRATTGRPHWLVIDEAHHVLEEVFRPAQVSLPGELYSCIFITVHPERLQRPLLERIDFVIGVGPDADIALDAFSTSVGKAPPTVAAKPEQPGQVLFWDTRLLETKRVTVLPARAAQRRHRRKYARGELGPDRSFYFRGPEEKLNLRAQNLLVFNEIAQGVDEETWAFHLGRGDYSAWVHEAIKDEALAEQIRQVEGDRGLSAKASRERIRNLIEEQYTAPA